MLRRRVISATLLLLLTACASQVTPQQEWVMKTFAQCRDETGAWNAVLEEVRPDGHFTVRGSQTVTDASTVIACMRAKQLASRAGVDAYQRGDYPTALREFQQAADQGEAYAQYGLGLLYANGRGVPQDHTEAVKWYRRAAEQGYASAQHNLGTAYAKGQGVAQDHVHAHIWFTLAAQQYQPGARRDQSLAARDLEAQKMTPAEIAEAERVAREWQPKAERQ